MVRPSVRHTVAITPMRAPTKAQTSLPAAPPANTSVSESPTVGRLAPFASSTNGRKIRKPMRVALSIMPIASSSGKPERPARECIDDVFAACEAAGDADAGSTGNLGASQKIATAAATPAAPSSASVGCHGSTTSSSEAEAGSDIFPMSPAKL